MASSWISWVGGVTGNVGPWFSERDCKGCAMSLPPAWWFWKPSSSEKSQVFARYEITGLICLPPSTPVTCLFLPSFWKMTLWSLLPASHYFQSSCTESSEKSAPCYYRVKALWGEEAQGVLAAGASSCWNLAACHLGEKWTLSSHDWCLPCGCACSVFILITHF